MISIISAVSGSADVCGGIVAGRVRFVRYAFFTIKNARQLNSINLTVVLIFMLQ